MYNSDINHVWFIQSNLKFSNLFFINLLLSSFQDHGFISVSEKADRETLNTIEDKYYIEDDFDPKEYELQVPTFFLKIF